MTRIRNLSRRLLLKGAATSGLLLGIQLDLLGAAGAAEEGGKPASGAAPAAFSPNVFVALDTSGQVTLTVNRSEMGQGIRTSLAMVLADEMAASWQKITVRQAEGDPKYGDQNTDRSRSMRLLYLPMRQAGAAARQILETAAAQMWKASIRDCRAVDHEVIHVPSGRSIGFGQLAKAAAAVPAPPGDKIRLLDPSAHRYIGHPIPSIDLLGMLHGKAVYGADINSPGMRHASIERCPVFGGKVKSYDAKDALGMKGVERVVEIPAGPLPSGHLPLGGIAVIANNTWTAEQARKKLKIDWDSGPNATHDSASYRTELEAATRKLGRPVRSQGNFEPAFAGAAKKVSAEYFVPYYSHAMMEPPVAIAGTDKGQTVIYAPTQDPQGARTAVAQYLGVKDTDVTVRSTLIGSAFGRKAMHDFVCEAAWLSRTLGETVKVAWTREDDIRHDYYHPMCAQRIDAGLDKNGLPVAWRQRTAFPSLNSTFQANAASPDAAQLGEGFTDMPYLVPNVRLEVASVPSHMRLGWHHSSMNIPHAFAICSFIDELAAAAGKDPANYAYSALAGPRNLDLKAAQVDYPNYGGSIEEYPIDIGRIQNVLQYVMERSGWGEALLPRQGRGIAVHRSYLSYVAAVAVVAVSPDGQITIPRFDIAIDCGSLINPDRVKTQMESAVMFGIGLTLYSNLTVKNGAVEQANLDTYRMPRADAMPDIHVHILPSGAPPGGAGDPGVPVIAPAICNAIFAAVGKRIRSLPVDPTLLKD